MSVRRAAVLGSPISHSLSPVLHRAAYTELGLTEWAYDRIECAEYGLAPFVTGLDERWAGLSLTMPLKRVALDVADDVSDLVAAVGAANTLTRTSGGWRADNTDVHGVEQALRETGLDAVGSAVILGAGGTAQACLPALAALGCTAPLVLVRDANRAGAVRETADRLGLTVEISDRLADGPPPADVVISTLPGAAADAVRCADGTAVALDVVYHPWPTPFAEAAAAGGVRVQSGLAMLLHQAAAQVELMTGRPAPVDAMRTALDAAVAARASVGR